MRFLPPVLLLVTLVSLTGATAAARAAESAVVRQILLAGTQLTLEPQDAPTPPETVPLAGGFLLTPKIGPLDWDVFALDNLRARRRGGSENAVVVRGDGAYQRGGRTGNEERLRVTLSGADWTATLDSGAVPIGPSGALRSLDLKGTTVRAGARFTVVLHLEVAPELQRWHYRLLPDSEFLDDCPICDRLSIPWPMTGSFDLVLTAETPIGNQYRVVDAAFTAGNGIDLRYTLTGEGTYTLGGEVTVRQTLDLTLDVVAPANTRTSQFAVRNPVPGRRWPMFHADADETTGSLASTYRLQIRAAPFHELWFTVRNGMTPANTNATLGHLSGGDVLADTGRRVRSNADLLAAFGWQPETKPVNVYALDAGAGGGIEFSVDEVKAPNGQVLAWGDLLAEDGILKTTVPRMLAPFGLMPPAPDAGLDAVQSMGNGERLFSLRTDVFSERLGQVLHHGDILSDRGAVFLTFDALLAAFKPKDPAHDPGLDAFHVWPSGEVWFSTVEGFVSNTLGPILGGNLLSQDGYIVYRNLDLVAPFSPLEDLADFGLNDLFVLTDTDTPPAPATNLRLDLSGPDAGAWTLTWNGSGRVFQVEQATEAAGFYTPAGPPQPERTFRLPPDTAGGVPRFLRVRSW
jgi:hypothetical protein